jgi:hypothetical protein
MAHVIQLDATHLNTLDLTPAQRVIESLLATGGGNQDLQLQFAIEYPSDANDPRELPEIPEVRLWFVRLDAYYPWLPIWLDWQSGELWRYAAMLVPHQFSSKDGIQFNPEALEIFLMHKLFVLTRWLHQQGIPSREKLKGMAKVLGYELDDTLFNLLEA